jgi:hypothetical protein
MPVVASGRVQVAFTKYPATAKEKSASAAVSYTGAGMDQQGISAADDRNSSS